LYPLDPLGLAQQRPGPVDAGWARALHRSRLRTVQEILDDASRQMDAQDEAERRARDPLAYIGAHRRPSLWNRLMHGRR
jgi:hypothetical protein